jgi:hypothetical protein
MDGEHAGVGVVVGAAVLQLAHPQVAQSLGTVIQLGLATCSSSGMPFCPASSASMILVDCLSASSGSPESRSCQCEAGSLCLEDLLRVRDSRGHAPREGAPPAPPLRKGLRSGSASRVIFCEKGRHPPGALGLMDAARPGGSGRPRRLCQEAPGQRQRRSHAHGAPDRRPDEGAPAHSRRGRPGVLHRGGLLGREARWHADPPRAMKVPGCP